MLRQVRLACRTHLPCTHVTVYVCLLGAARGDSSGALARLRLHFAGQDALVLARDMTCPLLSCCLLLSAPALLFAPASFACKTHLGSFLGARILVPPSASVSPQDHRMPATWCPAFVDPSRCGGCWINVLVAADGTGVVRCGSPWLQGLAGSWLFGCECICMQHDVTEGQAMSEA